MLFDIQRLPFEHQTKYNFQHHRKNSEEKNKCNLKLATIHSNELWNWCILLILTRCTIKNLGRQRWWNPLYPLPLRTTLAFTHPHHPISSIFHYYPSHPPLLPPPPAIKLLIVHQTLNIRGRHVIFLSQKGFVSGTLLGNENGRRFSWFCCEICFFRNRR